MKKRITLLLVLALALSVAALMGCATKVEDPGPPPPEVIAPETPSTETSAPETPSTGAATPETPPVEAAAPETLPAEAAEPDTPPAEAAAPETPAAETAAPEAPAAEAAAPQTPPAEAGAPEAPASETAVPEAPVTEATAPDNATDGVAQEESSATAYRGEVLRNAVSAQIGQGSQKNWSVNMYDNAAAATMLGYLSESGLLFPTYTYDESRGFVAQNVRGSYTRDDETTVTNVKAGELYLFSGGQLRFYFKDVPGANITATPIGYYADTEGLTDAVIEAYESNLDDVWCVGVYFVI